MSAARRSLPSASILAALAVAACHFATGAAAPATEDAAPNPVYAQWAGLKVGAWVRVRVLSTSRNFERTTKLVAVTPDEVRLEETEAAPGGQPGPARVRVVRSRLEGPGARAGGGATKPAGADDSGDAELPVAGVKLKCHGVTRGARKPGADPTAGDTTWTCPGVPGFVKRVSWLPADPALGLPEVDATEMLAAWDLPPREDGPAPAGAANPATAPAAPAGRIPVRAGPPTKFSWTYRFDPPGWRHWSRVDDSVWEERWESGQVTRARVVGWVAEGPAPGTIVRRLDDSVETLIPDAGKGARVLFRRPPDGKWAPLGEVEESE